MQARERFRDATAAARSSLQRAVAERYLLLCAVALGRQDVAKTALDQLNREATTAALEVGDTIVHAYDMARSHLEDRGEARGFGKERRLTARAGEIRHGASEAARVVANLLSEAGAVGQTLGQTQPPAISTVLPEPPFSRGRPPRHVAGRTQRPRSRASWSVRRHLGPIRAIRAHARRRAAGKPSPRGYGLYPRCSSRCQDRSRAAPDTVRAPNARLGFRPSRKRSRHASRPRKTIACSPRGCTPLSPQGDGDYVYCTWWQDFRNSNRAHRRV